MRNRILSPALGLLPIVLSISSAVAFTSSLSAQSLDYDRKVGAEAAEMVVRTKGLYNDPRLLQFFEELGKRLVDGLGDQPFTYRFAISNEVEPNAYALPAGWVFSTRTLFAVASSEAEVAGVIGHEIIHSHRRHAVLGSHHAFYAFASISALQGRSAEAVRWLRKAAETGMPNYPMFARDPNLALIRPSAEYLEFMAALKVRWDAMDREFR